ncbi:MAG: type II toxin-antitoxin system VapC family toxin [Spirochaetia bacterium]
MIAVLDASAAIGILLRKKDGEKYFETLISSTTVIAPDLYISEITNVAWKHHKLQNFTHEEAATLAEDGIALIDQYIPTKDLWKEALRESINNDHPAYDAVYAICARRNDAVLLTYDKRLKQLCKKLKLDVL